MPDSDFARHTTSPRASSEKKLCRPFANTDFNSASSLSDTALLPFSRSTVRSVDVARHMDVSKPSVSHAVATLKDGGFLTMDEDYFLHLTDIGREVAEQIYEKHRFFTERLIAAGVDPETAEQDACRIEHVISDESFQCLKEAMSQE